MITKSIIFFTVYIIIMTDQPYIYCINDKLYNLSDFVSKHPGGTDVFYNLHLWTFTPFRIKDAQYATPSTLITATRREKWAFHKARQALTCLPL